VVARPTEAASLSLPAASTLTATGVTTTALVPGRVGGAVFAAPAAAAASVPIPVAIPRAADPREAARRVPAVRPSKAARALRTQVGESAQAHADRRGAAALAALGYPTKRLGFTIAFRPYTGGTLGFADGRARRITLYVKRTHTDSQLRVSLAHEIGHVLDFTTSTKDTRRDYLDARGLAAGTTWFGCNGCSDYATPAGDFAEVFALWLAGPGDFRSQLAAAPGRAQLTDLGRRFFQPPS